MDDGVTIETFLGDVLHFMVTPNQGAITSAPGDADLDLPVIATGEDLDRFLLERFGVVLPNVCVCTHKGHKTPHQAFHDAYFARYPVTVWKASRGFGGKSFTLALLALTEAVTLKADVNVLGGSGQQSARILESQKRLWAYPNAPRAALKSEPGAIKTALRWENTIIALMASQKSVRGPHPQRLRMDEVDEMDVDILRSALGQPMNKGAVLSQVVLSSTHQYADGTMTWTLEQARIMGWPVYEWCFAAGTRVTTDTGERAIETIQAGDVVLTTNGWKKVGWQKRTGTRPTLALKLSNGRTIRCTADHKLRTETAWIKAENLHVGDCLLGLSPAVETTPGRTEQDGVVSALPAAVGMDTWPSAGQGDVFAMRRDNQAARQVLPRLLAKGISRSQPGIGRTVGAASRRWQLAVQNVACGASGAGTAERIGRSLGCAPAMRNVRTGSGVAGSRADDRRARRALARAARSSRPRCAPRRSRRTRRLSRADLVGAGSPSLVSIVAIEPDITQPVYDLHIPGPHNFVAEGIVVHNCLEETREPHGWLTSAEIDRKRATMTILDWQTEVELQEPTNEDPAIFPQIIDALFSKAHVLEAAPEEGARYAHGADWAKEAHFTSIVTLRKAKYPIPMVLVKMETTNREPWPTMIGRFNERVLLFKGPAAHDETGLGTVVADFLTVDAEGFQMVGNARKGLFSECIAGLEHFEIVIPDVPQQEIVRLRSVLKNLKRKNLYGSGHPPDEFVALAMAYHAASQAEGGSGQIGFPAGAAEKQVQHLSGLAPDAPRSSPGDRIWGQRRPGSVWGKGRTRE